MLKCASPAMSECTSTAVPAGAPAGLQCQPTNLFIANLATADVLIGLFAVPFQFQVLVVVMMILAMVMTLMMAMVSMVILNKAQGCYLDFCHTFPVSDGDNDVADAG